jgi:5-methylcytosine-specific restriction endonuclease McrA
MPTIYNKEYYLRHREKESRRRKIYHFSHQEEIRARKKEYYATHKTERDIYQLKRRREHLLEVRAAEKRYKRSEKGKFVAINCNHKRRTQERNGSGITNRQWNELLRSYYFRCAYCGIQGNMTVDHVVPLSKGGEHSIENIVPACIECNKRKGARLDWKPKIYKKVVG